MLCPYRFITNYEYAMIGNSIIKDKDVIEFAKCKEDECPLYETIYGCARARKEITDADLY